MTKLTPIERFMAKVEISPTGCWLWTSKPGPDGYGRFWLDGRSISAHVGAYLLFVGPVPADRELDHVCHSNDPTCLGGSTCSHRLHVNPFLCLEPVTHRENSLRGRTVTAANAAKTRCDNGHPFDAANTLIIPAGRSCRICQRACEARYRAKRRAARLKATNTTL